MVFPESQNGMWTTDSSILRYIRLVITVQDPGNPYLKAFFTPPPWRFEADSFRGSLSSAELEVGPAGQQLVHDIRHLALGFFALKRES